MATPTPLDIPRRSAAISAFRAGGGGVAAVFPIHYPRALFRAFDLLPVEVWGPPHVETTSGDAHLQSYICSIVRAGLSFLLDGGLDIADVVAVPHGCDSLQGLGSLLIDLVDVEPPVVTVYPPRGEGKAATDFLASEIGALYHRLAAITGQQPGDDVLSAVVSREEAADARLAELWSARARLPMSDRDFYRLARAREYLPAERFAELAGAALDQPPAPEPGAIPLVLSGVVPEPYELFDALADAGGWIAVDDTLCCGRRLYPAGTAREPRRRMAQSLLGGPPDATRGHSIARRAAHVCDLVERSGARGVLFYWMKFCEPEQFYLPGLQRALEARGVRSTVIEVEVQEPLPSRVVTRLEAFLETLA